MPTYSIDEIKDRVVDAAARFNQMGHRPNKIASVSLFGSYAEGHADSGSDVDLLVRFDSDTVSLITFADVLMMMEDRFGVPVDVVQDPIPADSFLELKAVIPLYVYARSTDS